MTFADLQNLTSFWLDDLQFGYFTQTQVSLWLNNAQRELQKKLIKAGQNYYMAPQVQTPCIVNQRVYSLPLDLKKINRLEVKIDSSPVPFENVQPILPITTNQQDLISIGPGLPLFYYLNRTNLILRPAPDTAYTLRLNYTYQVADMVNLTDVPDAPEAYHEFLALMATQDGFIKDGRVNELLIKKLAEYEAQLLSDSQERTQDTPRGIIDTGGDVHSSFFW